ncbi:MAG: protein phosphatase 2C domain-containing protein, partial [Candidatus Methanofastidiosia archaeon]
MLSEAIQKKYVIGQQSVVGDPRRKYEDRAYIREIERKNGAPLLTAIVADGVGSADFGARGAQLAIDTVVDLITRSRGD